MSDDGSHKESTAAPAGAAASPTKKTAEYCKFYL